MWEMSQPGKDEISRYLELGIGSQQDENFPYANLPSQHG